MGRPPLRREPLPRAPCGLSSPWPRRWAACCWLPASCAWAASGRSEPGKGRGEKERDGAGLGASWGRERRGWRAVGARAAVLSTLFSRQGLGGGGRRSARHAESGASPQSPPAAPSSQREQVGAARLLAGGGCVTQGLRERSPAPAPTPSAFLSGVGILASSSGRAHGAEKAQIHFAWGVWVPWWGLVVPAGSEPGEMLRVAAWLQPVRKVLADTFQVSLSALKPRWGWGWVAL